MCETYQNLGTMSLVACMARCDQNPSCNIVEVNNCRGQTTSCTGTCYLFFGNAYSVYNGNCSNPQTNRASWLKVPTFSLVPSSSAGCGVTTNRSCITITQAPNQQCNWTSRRSAQLQVVSFDTEPYYDWITVNGQRFSGTGTELDGSVVAANGTLQWRTDGSITRSTPVQVCATNGLPVPAPPGSLSTSQYTFLFNGCPRGGIAQSWVNHGPMTLLECELVCDRDPNCHAIEVNGCLTNTTTCGGFCYTFTGTGTSIRNGNCVTNGDQRAYVNGHLS